MSLSLSRTTIWQSVPDETTDLTILSGSYDASGSVTVFGRLGLVDDRSGGEARGWGVANPAVGAKLGVPLARHLRLGIVAGTTVPIGSGGGDYPRRPIVLRTMLSGTDWGGPMFGPNHIDVYEGLSLTADPGRFTLRLRSTLHPALRVRGKRTDPLGPRVIFTSSGVRVGYAVTPKLSAFTELAETRFLNNPAFLGDDRSARSDHYAVAGLALDFKLGPVRRLQPTVMYARAADAPKSKRGFHLVEIDVRLSF